MSWDDEDVDVPVVSAGSAVGSGKWDDEDVDTGPVKDAWDEEEAPKVVKPKPEKKKPPPKKVEVIEEELADPVEEKKRKQKQIEEADMRNTADLFSGIEDKPYIAPKEKAPEPTPAPAPVAAAKPAPVAATPAKPAASTTSAPAKKAAASEAPKKAAEVDILAPGLSNATNASSSKAGQPGRVIKVEGDLASFEPKTEADFDQLAALIYQRIQPYEKRHGFELLVKSLTKKIASSPDISSDVVKEINKTLTIVANDKLKQEKEKKQGKKKATTAPAKKSLNTYEGRDDDAADFGDDDFM
eukprot:TRINITY_DN4259_c0_g2_i1.p1 TRINITY_DN4259_c0_g2~~TRINITY_DN4259_c0_g2_i1.p1  ORF type:complete len:299 (-),score=109.50 TRINITY_DN4259_c0_g2_i1:189-1085(-)